MTGASNPATWTLPKILIDRDGVWFADGGEVTHPGILANLVDNLRVDAQGHHLQVGPARVPVEVEDAPFVVVRVEPEGDGAVLTLSDLTREPLDVATLVLGPGEIPYSRVKGGRFLARWSRAATWELLQHVEPDAGASAPTLVLGGLRRAIPQVDRAAIGLGGERNAAPPEAPPPPPAPG
ncbi:MAG TPA: hypothetical protein VML54_16995 [Candidatus Limnocylindrales bacterium]|nr:hypothetical protein [Candidatus Limnocylindrales bacterium]